MNSKFIPNYGNESDISASIQNGNLYVSEDTKRLFFDLNGKRIKVSDVVFSDEKPLIGISGKLYIIKSDNSLWIFEDTWKQLNSSSSGSVNVDNKTINKNSDDQIQSIGVIDSRSGEPVKYWTGTLVQYDAIETKDDNTIYNITDDIIDINQNHFLPAGTILTIETDGSGQFTKLSDAINYLANKWSNGTVTIQLGEGNFVETDYLFITGGNFNIPRLLIKGKGQTETNISFNTVSSNENANLVFKYVNNIFLEDLKLTSITTVSNNLMTLFNSSFTAKNCHFTKSTKIGNIVNGGGMTTSCFESCIISNAYNGFVCTTGALTTIYNCSYTNVTNETVSGNGSYYKVNT